jgi:guanine deaminase
MNNRKKFMEEAINLAKQNLKYKNGGPFGAVVVKDGKIIGRGVNTVTTQNDPTAHAEVNAIREACSTINSFQLEECEIYSSCEPCPMCLGAIYWARPKKFYYAATREDAARAGFDDSEIYREIQLPIRQRKIPSEQIMENEANEVFITWINLEQKIAY